MTNFLDVPESEDRSNKWRNIIVSIILLIAFGGGFFWYVGIPMRIFEKTDAQAAALPTLAERVFDWEHEEDEADVPPEPEPVVEIPVVEPPKLPKLTGELPDPGEFSAKAIIVKDAESGMVLYAKNEYDKRSIASVSKLMSALVLLEKSPDWDLEVPVSRDDVLGTHMYAGEVYTVESLWRAALVGSSNKAVLTLVDAIDWPREAFIERMNQKALELGMSDTHFEEPTGLNAGNVSTAADVSLLLHEALKVNEIRQTLLLPEYSLVSTDKKETHHIWNTNWILLNWIPHQFFDLRGGKTGYIPAAGYNFTMEVADAYGHTIDVVVLGAENHEARFTEARDVASEVFEQYVWPDMEDSTTQSTSMIAGEKIYAEENL